MGLLGRFLSKIPPIRQCDSETKSKISSFFEWITMYIYRIRARHTGGVGVGRMSTVVSANLRKKTSVSVSDKRDCFKQA